MSGVNVVGQRFGRLLVVEMIRVLGKERCRCVCDCGSEKVATKGHLRQGLLKSCGCLNRELIAERGRALLTKHGQHKTPTWYTWQSMLRRCDSPSSQYYRLYGGRGISVCDRWKESFTNFLADMGERPLGMTLDRYPDQNGNYEPGNCRWATASQQARNRSQNRFVEAHGKRMTIIEWSELTGLSHQCILERLNAGWPDERAVSQPSMRSPKT